MHSSNNISGIKMSSNENDAMEWNDIHVETKILIYHMPKRSYGCKVTGPRTEQLGSKFPGLSENIPPRKSTWDGGIRDRAVQIWGWRLVGRAGGSDPDPDRICTWIEVRREPSPEKSNEAGGEERSPGRRRATSGGVERRGRAAGPRRGGGGAASSGAGVGEEEVGHGRPNEGAGRRRFWPVGARGGPPAGRRASAARRSGRGPRGGAALAEAGGWVERTLSGAGRTRPSAAEEGDLFFLGGGRGGRRDPKWGVFK